MIEIGAYKYLSVLFVAIFATSVNAQCNTSHRVIRRHSPVIFPTTNQYPVREIVKEVIIKDIIDPIVVPVLVPSYQFQYVAPCHQAIATPGVAPVVTPGLPQGLPAAPVQSDDSVKQLARALLAEMGKLSGPQGQPVDDGPPMANDLGDAKATTGDAKATAVSDGFKILQSKCARCHTGVNSKGSQQIFLSLDSINQQLDSQKMLSAIGDGTNGQMPPNNSPEGKLTPQEVAIVRAYLTGQ